MIESAMLADGTTSEETASAQYLVVRHPLPVDDEEFFGGFRRWALLI